MNNQSIIKKCAYGLALTFALAAAEATHAAVYYVEVNTTSLAGNPNAPFYLDFQMNYGGSGAGNSATVNNFAFGGGSPSGTPTVFSGNPVGNLTTGIGLTADTLNPFNEIYQSFNPGSLVGFNVSVTSNGSGPTPDSFHFALLDSSTFQIPTAQPNLGLDLFEVDINGTAMSQSWSGTGDYAGVTVSFVPVPEASTCLAGLSVLVPLGLQLIRRKRANA